MRFEPIVRYTVLAAVVAVWADGAMLVVDDGANKIWRMSYGK